PRAPVRCAAGAEGKIMRSGRRDPGTGRPVPPGRWPWRLTLALLTWALPAALAAWIASVALDGAIAASALSTVSRGPGVGPSPSIGPRMPSGDVVRPPSLSPRYPSNWGNSDQDAGYDDQDGSKPRKAWLVKKKKQKHDTGKSVTTSSKSGPSARL